MASELTKADILGVSLESEHQKTLRLLKRIGLYMWDGIVWE